MIFKVIVLICERGKEIKVHMHSIHVQVVLQTLQESIKSVKCNNTDSNNMILCSEIGSENTKTIFSSRAIEEGKNFNPFFQN